MDSVTVVFNGTLTGFTVTMNRTDYDLFNAGQTVPAKVVESVLYEEVGTHILVNVNWYKTVQLVKEY